jgi:hypothetical protein
MLQLMMRVLLILMLIGPLGCGSSGSSDENVSPFHEPRSTTLPKGPETAQKETPKPETTAAVPEPSGKKALLGKDVWIENLGQRRRVLVACKVCLREGMYGLECLLCRARTKEYESLLSTEADARVIDAALRVAGAEPGAPVGSVEKKGKFYVVPPRGPKIKVLLRYSEKGKTVTVRAQEWVRSAKTKKALADEWVFTGSQLVPDFEDPKKKPPHYGANDDGGYINILNMAYAMMDLPINQPNQDPSEREFQPYTEHIPAVGTQVTMILEPEKPPEKKK